MAAERNPLRPYEQLGVVFTDQSGDDDQADCPFCGKERRFHFASRKEQWICSTSPAVCGRTGNTTSFLSQWHEFCLDETTPEDYASLAEARDGLPLEAFRYWGVALNHLTGEWLLPSYNALGKLQDLRRWKPGRGIQGVAGCKNNLWGAQVLADEDRSSWPVDLCEGEWDGIALSWLNRRAKRRAVVVAVPGARVFKDEWVQLFRGREVTWYYDHDADGERFSAKNSKKLRGVVKSQCFVRWPEKFKDKYDVRDYICDNAVDGRHKSALKKLQKLVVVNHWYKDAKEEGTSSGTATTEEREPIVRPKKNITLRQALRVYRNHLVMSKDMEDALRVIYAVVIGNQLPDDPLWMYLVGPPSGGKTELLMSLAKVPDVSYHSSVSAKSMLSGYKTPGNQDPSLIPKLIDRIAVFKDWTEVLSSHEHEVNQLSGLMRGAYDGHIKRVFGNGESREYKGTFNVLAGVTNMIHAHNDTLMGERFLKFQLQEMSQREQQRLIAKILNSDADTGRNNALQDAANGFLNRAVEGPYPPLEEWVSEKINALSRFVAQLRAKVPWRRDGMDKFLEYEPMPEVGARLAKQFKKLGQALAIVDGSDTVGKEAYRLIHRVAMDTAIGWPQKLLSQMLLTGPADVKTLSEEIRMDQSSVRRVLKDMQAMGVVVSRENKSDIKQLGRYPTEWHVSRVTMKLCEEVQFNAYDRQEERSVAVAGA
jgi:hypothetical protein